MKVKKCGTCKFIEEIYNLNQKLIEKEKSLEPSSEIESDRIEVLKVKLVTQIFDKEGRFCGGMGYRARVLNFCPQCGKKIEDSKKKWRM